MSELKNALESDNVGLAAYLYTVPPDQFRKDISQLQASGWISVETAIPRYDDYVQVKVSRGSMQFEGEDFWDFIDMEFEEYGEYVTHWKHKTPPTE